MDISSIISWIQLFVWLYVVITFVKKRKEKLRGWLLPRAIAVGFILNAVSLYLNWRSGEFKVPFLHRRINITHFSPPLSVQTPPLVIVSKQRFEDQQVPLDGYAYADSTFINVCLMYEGGPYQFQNVTFEGPVKICTNNERINNVEDLWFTLGFVRGAIERVQKTFIKSR